MDMLSKAAYAARRLDLPRVTMFMLMSVDGKISTGSTAALDFDRDLRKIHGVKEGLWQYYDAEANTDVWSCLTGKTAAKIGVNDYRGNTDKHINCNMIVFDNNHISSYGLRYYCDAYLSCILVSDDGHPAVGDMLKFDNFDFIYRNGRSLGEVLEQLKREHGVAALTLQGGGTLNAAFLREGLVDIIDIIIAPVVVGGQDTPTLVEGESLTRVEDLHKVVPLKLRDTTVLNGSYVRLRYDVLNKH